VSISLGAYSTTGAVRVDFALDEGPGFTAMLSTSAGEGPQNRTNYEAGLNAAGDAFTAAGAEATDTNLVVFLSDGFPVPGGQDIAGAAQQLETDFDATISGIGVGQFSSMNALQLLDNTPTGATQVLSGQELLDVIVQPLTDADFLRFEIVIEGIDDNGDPVTQTLTINEGDVDGNGDPIIVTTQLGWSIPCLPLDPMFVAPQDISVTVNGIFAADPDGSSGAEQVVTTGHDIGLVVCFTPGTRLLTPSGEVEIMDLEVGDRVITRDHGVQRIRWIGTTTRPAAFINGNPGLRPILIRRDALGPDQPSRDMRVSRQHRILVRGWRAEMLFGESEGVLVPAYALCNDTTIVEDRAEAPVTYVHVAFDQHEVVFADGVEAESFHPVSYTHLMLPTNREGSVSLVAVPRQQHCE